MVVPFPQAADCGCPHCRVLHSLLLQNSDEFGDPNPDALRRLVANTRLQIGLLACAAELVLYASSGQPSFPALTQRLAVLGCVLDMWEGLQHTQRVLLQASSSLSTQLLSPLKFISQRLTQI